MAPRQIVDVQSAVATFGHLCAIALYGAGALSYWAWSWNASRTVVTQLGLLQTSTWQGGITQISAGSMSAISPSNWPALQAGASMLLIGMCFSIFACFCAGYQLAMPKASHSAPLLIAVSTLALLSGFTGTVIGCTEFSTIIAASNYGPAYPCAIVGTICSGIATFTHLVCPHRHEQDALEAYDSAAAATV